MRADYIVTSNHIHLIVRDHGEGEIAQSMQLIAGRTAQEYNQRKGRKGAYWEDRYHATAVDTDDYFSRCLVYIDLRAPLKTRSSCAGKAQTRGKAQFTWRK